MFSNDWAKWLIHGISKMAQSQIKNMLTYHWQGQTIQESFNHYCGLCVIPKGQMEKTFRRCVNTIQLIILSSFCTGIGEQGNGAKPVLSWGQKPCKALSMGLFPEWFGKFMYLLTTPLPHQWPERKQWMGTRTLLLPKLWMIVQKSCVHCCLPPFPLNKPVHQHFAVLLGKSRDQQQRATTTLGVSQAYLSLGLACQAAMPTGPFCEATLLNPFPNTDPCTKEKITLGLSSEPWDLNMQRGG